MRTAALAIVIAACDSRDGSVQVDAASVEPPADDASSRCMPATPDPPPACLALAPSTLQGTTPFGNLDLALEYVGAGDCITISSANLTWRGVCGEQLGMQFPYPVSSDSNGRRRVVTDFDTDARVQFKPTGVTAVQEDVTMIHVEVITWEEGQGIHDIDITVTVADAAYGLAPMHVQGTFCDWPYYLC